MNEPYLGRPDGTPVELPHTVAEGEELALCIPIPAGTPPLCDAYEAAVEQLAKKEEDRPLVRKLGASLRGLLGPSRHGCPFCGMLLVDGAYHEFDADTSTWRCKTLLEPR